MKSLEWIYDPQQCCTPNHKHVLGTLGTPMSNPDFLYYLVQWTDEEFNTYLRACREDKIKIVQLPPGTLHPTDVFTDDIDMMYVRWKDITNKDGYGIWARRN